MDEVATRVYVRMKVADKPGVLGNIATIFGSQGVSIQSVIQESSSGDLAEIVWLMHKGRERNLRLALEAIGHLDIVEEITSVIRVED